MTTINVIDASLHAAAFPTTWTPPGPLQALGITLANITSQSTSAVSGSVPSSFGGPLAGNSFTVIPGNISQDVDSDMLAGYFTAAGNAVIIPVGLYPTNIEVMDWTGTIKWQWMYGAPATDALKLTGTPTDAVDTTSAIVITADAAGGLGNVTYITLSAGLAVSAHTISFRVEE